MSDLLNSASLVMIPSGYKEDVVYSQIPTDGSGDLSFTRASNGTRINSAGLVEVAPWNFCDYSEDQTQWTSQNETTVTANSTTAPNGTTTADTVTPSTANDDHYRGIVLGQQVGALTAFIYVKPNGYNFFDWGIWNGSQYIVRATFDLVNLTYTFTNAGTATIESVGNGWLKCGISGTNASFTTMSLYYRSRPTGGTGAFTGNGTSGAFIWGAQLNIGSTAKPYFPTTDRLNVPRLTYQNGGGGCPSLLLEKQSTNYARKNNDLVDWGIVNSGSLTKNLNAATSPDGTTNAINLVPNTANSAKMIYDNLTLQLAGGNFTMSCYAKANGYSKFGVRESATVGYYATFNLSTGTVIDNGGNTASIENVGNGWYRCIVSVVYSGTVNIGLLPLNDSYTSGQPLSHSYTGDGTKGVLVYGPQLEVSSSYATSLISTAGVASATRVADACYKTGISSLIGQTEGVVYAEIYPQEFQNASYIGISDGSTSNRIIFGFESGSVNSGNLLTFGKVSFPSSFTATRDQKLKVAIGYKSGDSVLYINGTQIGTDTSTFTATFNQAGYNWQTTGQPFKGKSGGLYLFPTRLTNSELASLTTI